MRNFMKYYHLRRPILNVWAGTAFLAMACSSTVGTAVAATFLACELAEEVADGEDDGNADNEDDQEGLYEIFVHHAQLFC